MRRLGQWLWMRPAWYGIAHGLVMTTALVVALPFSGSSLGQAVFRAILLGTVWGACLGLERHRAFGRHARGAPLPQQDGQHHRSGMP